MARGIGTASSSESPSGAMRRPARSTLVRASAAAVAVAVACAAAIAILAGDTVFRSSRAGRGVQRAAERPSSAVHRGGLGIAAPPDRVVGASAHPEWRTVGTSVQGRPIRQASFGSGPRKLLVLGGVHGREFGAPVAEAFAAYLARNPTKVPPGVEIDVLACANPDGRVADQRGNSNHVNINRNFPTDGWRPQLVRGLSAGPKPASEPETRVIMRVVSSGYDAVVSLHSQGGLIDYDGRGSVPIARAMSEETGFAVTHLGEDKFLYGSLGRWAPEKCDTPVVTPELDSPTMTDEVRDALLAAAATVAQPQRSSAATQGAAEPRW